MNVVRLRYATLIRLRSKSGCGQRAVCERRRWCAVLRSAGRACHSCAAVTRRYRAAVRAAAAIQLPG
jgi:hypothetical protein